MSERTREKLLDRLKSLKEEVLDAAAPHYPHRVPCEHTPGAEWVTYTPGGPVWYIHYQSGSVDDVED